MHEEDDYAEFGSKNLIQIHPKNDVLELKRKSQELQHEKRELVIKLNASESRVATLSSTTETIVLKVSMACGGCVGAEKWVLGKMEGVETFDIDLELNKVTVKGDV